jgi:hypothetical protein
MRRSAELLKSGTGKGLLSAFDKEFPGMPFTAEKKLDLVLWKLRPMTAPTSLTTHRNRLVARTLFEERRPTRHVGS